MKVNKLNLMEAEDPNINVTSAPVKKTKFEIMIDYAKDFIGNNDTNFNNFKSGNFDALYSSAIDAPLANDKYPITACITLYLIQFAWNMEKKNTCNRIFGTDPGFCKDGDIETAINALVAHAITNIYEKMFQFKLQFKLQIPKNIVEIMPQAFFGSHVTEIDCSQFNGLISGAAFAGDFDVTSILLPGSNSATHYIATDTFSNCPVLETVNVPKDSSILYFDRGAFRDANPDVHIQCALDNDPNGSGAPSFLWPVTEDSFYMKAIYGTDVTKDENISSN